MQLVLITPPTTASTELKTVNSLFHTGLPVLHVRKPDADVPFLRRYLHEIEPHFLSRVVLHQHHELAQEFNLKGIHYKERCRPQPPIPRVVPGLTQSTSLHSIADLLQDWQHLDYAFLSPVFDSISKQGYMAAKFDEVELSAALQQAHMPVYALGGITADRVSRVKQLGFAGIGVLGAVWERPDPCDALQEFIAACIC